MPLQVEQSHCDAVSGFNHSESQKQADRVGERETENFFFF